MFFITTHDVICTHINTSAGINLRMNLGKFKFKIVIRGGLSMKIVAHEGNTNSSLETYKKEKVKSRTGVRI